MRLFVAINLPSAERVRLGAELARVVEPHSLPVRWLAPDTLHVTLKFLGEVPDTRLPEIRQTLSHAVRDAASFDLTISGFGAFPSKSRPNIFWVGIAAPADLNELYRKVDVAFGEIGFPREERDFRPHITVGRAQKDAHIRDRSVMDRIAAEFEYNKEIRVASIDLMRSHLGGRGARYEILDQVELR